MNNRICRAKKAKMTFLKNWIKVIFIKISKFKMKISNNFLVIKYVSIKTTTKNKSSYFIKKESPVIEDMITAIKV